MAGHGGGEYYLRLLLPLPQLAVLLPQCRDVHRQPLPVHILNQGIISDVTTGQGNYRHLDSTG